MVYNGGSSAWHGVTANYFGISKHSNSTTGEMVMEIGRDTGNTTFAGDVQADYLSVGNNQTTTRLMVDASGYAAFEFGGDATGSFCYNNTTSRNMAFGVNRQDDLVISNGGDVVIRGQATATGIKFDANGEVLDDYEEGTWTPAMINLGNHTTGSRWGTYTKIGRVVYYGWFYGWSSRTTTNGAYGVQVTDLPFTCQSPSNHTEGNSNVQVQVEHAPYPDDVRSNLIGYVMDNTTNIYFRRGGYNTSAQSLDGSVATSSANGYMWGSGWYLT
jgi:hypothetical protein